MPKQSEGLKRSGFAKSTSKRDQTTAFGAAMFDDRRVVCRAQMVLGYSRHVVTGDAKHLGAALAVILVQLELHGLDSTGTSTNRSRDISAP
jgi:hypothetical protein